MYPKLVLNLSYQKNCNVRRPKASADKSSTEIPCTGKESKQCSVCKSYSTRTILYVCESGHVICAHCQPDDLDAKQIRKGHGDCTSEAQTNHRRKDGVHTLKRHKSDIIHKNPKDLASGDCDKHDKTTKLKGKSKSGQQIKSIYSDRNVDHEFAKSVKNVQGVETIVEYKNVNFKESKSSDSDQSTPSLLELAEEIQDTLITEACPRPVVCPVLNCGKTIAMNSAMQHFYYDHPKVPRVVLTKGTSQNTFLKANEISMKTQCLNIFLLQEKECFEKIERKVSSLEVMKENFTPLLLMSAKMHTKQFKSANNKKRYTKHKINDINSNTFKENEMLLLWACKLEEPQIQYSITLISKDKKHGQSYIGESVHIRDEQDALAIIERAESLVVHGAAANRLLEHGQLSVILNVL